MSHLSFLKNITLEQVPSTKSAGGVKKQWNPDPLFMGIRLWKDGAVYPSTALVDAMGLEYKKATISFEPVPEGAENVKPKRLYEFPDGRGNGLDVIDSREWLQYKGEQHFLAIAVVPKDQPKVSLFGSTKYDDQGNFVNSVMDQGSDIFGKAELLSAVKEIYGVEPNEQGYIDLFIDMEVNLKGLSSNGIFLFPKKIARGTDKGQPEYVRRENVDIYGMAPVVPPVAEQPELDFTATDTPPVGLFEQPNVTTN